MKYLLAPANRNVLTQFALSNVLLAFDYDGTLSPIVSDRDHAPMRRRTHELLVAVCERYPCAVISGRSRSDVANYLGGAQTRYVVGNHGLEPTKHMPRFEALVMQMRTELAPRLQHLVGVEVEDKRYSLAVHYRRSRHVSLAREEIVRAIGQMSTPVRMMRGKCVINVLPSGAPHKGIALQELRAKARADTAIYVGDDVTDEDVFELDEPGRLLSIRIGRTGKSAAPYYIRTQREIDALLTNLLRLRQTSTSP